MAAGGMAAGGMAAAGFAAGEPCGGDETKETVGAEGSEDATCERAGTSCASVDAETCAAGEHVSSMAAWAEGGAGAKGADEAACKRSAAAALHAAGGEVEAPSPAPLCTSACSLLEACERVEPRQVKKKDDDKKNEEAPYWGRYKNYRDQQHYS
eukprot:4484433-Pleurochrysis_carterae.AAC.2